MKMLPYEVQRENIAVAYSILGGIPGKYFNLSFFCNRSIENAETVDAQNHKCGTIGCAMGWLAMHPYFQAQGLSLKSGNIKFTHASADDSYPGEAATYLFGYRAFDRFFDSYGYGINDERLITKHKLSPYRFSSSGEDNKQLALARLKDGYYARSRRAKTNKEIK